MWSDWLVVCDCGFCLSALWCPLSVPTILLGFLLSWTWGISSRLLQQSAAATPYLGRGVAPLGHTDFIFLGSKITAHGECSHEIKRYLLLGRKVMTNLDSILKSRDITLSTMVHLVKAMVFPVVMYGCEIWTTKIVEHWRIDAFELWCWRRLLRVPWTARRSNQSILKEISPGCSLEGLILKLKLQYFGHLMQKVDSLEKTLMLGNIEGRRRRGWHRMRWFDGIIDSMNMGLGELRELVMDRGPGVLRFMGFQRVRQTERINWTELKGKGGGRDKLGVLD